MRFHAFATSLKDIKLLGYDTVLIGNITDLSGKLIASIFRALFNFQSTRRHISEDFNLQIQTALTLRRLMSYIYGAPILDVSRSHTTTQHSR